MVLDRGSIVEFGTHAELMAQGKIYKKILKHSSSKKMWMKKAG